ncbi:dATP/dGTP diphosphohydrolase domain-containing protein, partial [Cutibacterium acnes]
NNWTGGYPWSHSVDALYRHLLSWQQGHNLDDESHLPHLAHAAWHCLALLAYQQHNAGVDTRNPWNQSDK